jgi:hypothetical protein
MLTTDDVLDCEATLGAIRHACVAGSCEAYARKEARTAAGLRKVAAAHRERAAALLAEVVRIRR